MQKVHSSREYNLCCPACGVEVSYSALKAHMMQFHHCKPFPIQLTVNKVPEKRHPGTIWVKNDIFKNWYFCWCCRTQMKIEMLKDLLCCVGEEKEDEPSVAYARQDDRSRRFFKFCLMGDHWSLSKASQSNCLKEHLLLRQEELRLGRNEAPEIYMKRLVGFQSG